MKLSVVVITKDEEAAIGRCLDSVRWADEIVVLDSGSTDRTVEIAREHGARVEVSADWPGFGPQKNRALALAGGEWVLSLDADEWVPEDLAAEIRAAIVSPDGHAGFELPRSSSFCGREMRHSGWWPDHILRLFRLIRVYRLLKNYGFRTVGRALVKDRAGSILLTLLLVGIIVMEFGSLQMLRIEE